MGKPIAKKRPRFVRRGAFVGTYNDQETEEGRFLLQITEQSKKYGVKLPLSGPIWIEIAFDMPIPKSTSKKNVVKMMTGEIEHTKKPDIDNLVKFVLDCFNGHIIGDDSSVVCLRAKKRYAKDPLTNIVISYDVKFNEVTNEL